MNTLRIFLEWLHANYPELGSFYDAYFEAPATDRHLICLNTACIIPEPEFRKAQDIISDYQLYIYAVMAFH